MYFRLLNIINPKYNQYLREEIVPPIQVSGIYKQMSLLVLYQVSSKLVTLLKLIYDSMYVCNILILIVVAISLVMSTSFTSYAVHIISNYLAPIL
jgi:hypothetical protein